MKKISDQLLEEKSHIIKKCIRHLNIREDHEDFFNDGFIALHHATLTYNPELDNDKNFDKYAFFYIENNLKNILSKKKKQSKQCNLLFDDQLIDAYNFELEVDVNISCDCMKAYLSLEDHELFKLMRDELSINEMALKLNCTPNHVKYKMSEIRKKIKKRL